MAFGRFVCFVAIRIPKEVEVEIVLVGAGPAIPTGAAGYLVAAVAPIESVGHMPVAVVPIGIAPYKMVVGTAIESVGHMPVAVVPIRIVGYMVTAVAPIESVGCIATVGKATGAVEYMVTAASAIESAGYSVAADSCYYSPFIVQTYKLHVK